MEDFFLKNGIALAALLVSTVTFYRNYLSPFSPTVKSAGRISLTKDPHTIDLTHALIFVDLIFSNTGSRKGVVEDVALRVVANGMPSFFVGKFFNTDRHLNFTDDLPPPKLESFIGFGLKGDESIIKRIGFSQREGDAPFVYEAGDYKAEILLFSAKGKRWITSGEFGFSVEKSDLDQLAKMQASPHPSGGFFINMVLQDKRTTESINRTKKLK